MTPSTSLALIVSALGRAFLFASGEVFHLDNKPIPDAYSLHLLWAFTVYVPPDGPTARADDSPYVEFQGVRARSTAPSRSDDVLENYGSIQLSLISMDDYDKHISRDPACDLNNQLSNGEASMSKYTVGFYKTHFMRSDINKTGVYYLLMSNCGNFTQGEVSGQVAVRNPFGFMSGTEYHKLSFYSYTTVLYIVLAFIWGMLCLTWRQEFIAIHGIVLLAIGLKVVDCVSWTVHLCTINLSGNASNEVVCTLVMITTLTSYMSYMFILVISQGWRMTEEVLGNCMLAKMGLFGLFWVAANYLREGATVFRQSFHISPKVMTATTVGSMITNSIVFVWIIMSLARLSKKLKERNLEDQLKAVSRFTVALVIAILASSMVAFLQLLDSMGSLEVAWKYQYLADGGLSQVIFAFVVLVAMCVWMPSAGSGQLGYAAPAGQNEDDGVWKEDSADDAEYDGGNKVAPATLGAADEDEDL